MKFARSSESAAAFIESRERRRERTKKRIPQLPVRTPRGVPSERPGSDPRYLYVALIPDTAKALYEHCLEFRITPNEFVKRCLAQAALSRSGT